MISISFEWVFCRVASTELLHWATIPICINQRTGRSVVVLRKRPLSISYWANGQLSVNRTCAVFCRRNQNDTLTLTEYYTIHFHLFNYPHHVYICDAETLVIFQCIEWQRITRYTHNQSVNVSRFIVFILCWVSIEMSTRLCSLFPWKTTLTAFTLMNLSVVCQLRNNILLFWCRKNITCWGYYLE